MSIALLLMLIFFSPTYAAENFNPLVLRINSALNLANNHTHGPSCFAEKSISEGNIEIFQDYADQYQLKEKCIKQICPNIDRVMNRLVVEQSPLHASHQIDTKIAPLKETLADLFTEIAGLSKDQNKWREQLISTNYEMTDNLAVAGLFSLIETDLSNPAISSLGKKTKTIDIAKIKSDLFKKYSRFTDKADAQRLTEFILDTSTNSRVAAMGANYLGAPYRYQMQYPKLNYQEAVRQDLRETTAQLKQAPENVKALVKLTRIDIDLEQKIQL